MPIRLYKKNAILRTEELLGKIGTESEIWLPASAGPVFFSETWFAAIIATAARSGPIRVVDWRTHSSSEPRPERFHETLEGLASLVFAESIIDSSGQKIEFDTHKLIQDVISNSGVLQAERGGKELTICAFDPECPVPLLFSGVSQQSQFSKELMGYRKEYLETGVGKTYSEDISKEDDLFFTQLLFELFQNSYEHGRHDSKAKNLRGLRSIMIRKHIGSTKHEMLNRCPHFPELAEYISATSSIDRSSKYYEVAISDFGLGILGRFMATRPDFKYPPNSPYAKTDLLNRIINEALTSKHSSSGAGHGLKRSFKAIQNLRGFVSLRTNDQSVHFNSLKATSGRGFELKSSTNGCMSEIAGTHYNILLPLH
jgi:hypothetical protein